MSERRGIHSSPGESLAVPPEAPIKKKRKSPLLSKAKSCIGCRHAKLRCNMEWPCSNCVRRGLAHECPGFVPHEPRAKSVEQGQHVSFDTAHSLASLASLADTATEESRHESVAPGEAVAQNGLASSPMRGQNRGDSNTSGGWPQYYGQSAHSSYLAASFSPPPLPPPSARSAAAASSDRSKPASSKRARRAEGDSWVQLDTDYQYFLDHVQDGMDESVLKDFKASIAWMYCPIEASKCRSVFDGAEADMLALRLVVKVVVFAWQTAVLKDHPAGSERIGEVALQQCWRALDKADWSRSNSLAVQQALFLLCIFLLNFDGGQMSERFSSVFGICVAKAIESGLYTDAKVGQDDDQTVQRQRQRLFWELYSLDAFRSLAYCRPCFFQDATISAAKPSVLTDDDAFHAIKYENAQIINRFMSHHLYSVRTDFQKTVDLDHQVRQLFEHIPSHLRVRRVNRISSGQHQSIRQMLQGCTIALNIHQTLLTLYRPWFVSNTLAEAQGKGDRHSAQYQRAKLCIGESASAMIDLCSRAYAVDPQTTMHWAFFLHHTFNAGVCRAIQAIYGHASDPLSYTAVDDVDEAIALLDKTQEHGCGQMWRPRAHVLRKLRQRIDRVYNGAARNAGGERSRRASYFSLLGATVPVEPAQSSTGTDQQQLQPEAESSSTSLLTSHDLASATPDDAASSSGWLDLLNADAFTLSMADLWSVEGLPSMDLPVNADQHADAAWPTPLHQ
ncbi:Zn(2)-C6 fungal-type domain-containing protein [Pseudozyma hubeiensis]|nr:Zn(2)-C6 fungal-type domain-containing protein [Pseudozyma hubeiensis]